MQSLLGLVSALSLLATASAAGSTVPTPRQQEYSAASIRAARARWRCLLPRPPSLGFTRTAARR